MTKKTRSTLATGFAVVAVILLLGVGTTAGILGINASHAIQSERAHNVRAACEKQNKQNGVAYVFLQSLPVSRGGAQLTPDARAELTHEFTDAVVGPVQNCDAVVKASVHSG